MARRGPRRSVWAAGLLLAQPAALVGTFFLPGLGTQSWHHVASLAVVLVAAVALWGPMRSRRFLGIGVLATTVLAAASGFYLLYWKEGIRVDGYQDWGVWWHVAWSWAAAVFFWQHTWVNRVACGHFFAQSLRRFGPAALHLGAYLLAVVGLVVTAGPGKGWFHVENYIPLSFWTWLAVLVPAYLAWWLVRRFSHRMRTRIRGRIDLALVPAAAVAVLSGIPLLFFDDPLNGAGLKYASKYWHVGPSILFTVLVFIHSVQLWNVVRGHWHKMDRSGLPDTSAPVIPK